MRLDRVRARARNHPRPFPTRDSGRGCSPGNIFGKDFQPLAESQWVMLAVVIEVTSYSPIPALLIRAEAGTLRSRSTAQQLFSSSSKADSEQHRVRVRSPLQPNTTNHREDRETLRF